MPQRSSLQVDCSGLAPVESSSSSSQSVAMQVETGKSYTIKPRTMALREDGDVEGPGEDRIEEQWNDSGDTYSEIPEVHTGEKIHKNGEATDDDIIHMIMKPVCSGCRINNKDNPNCFCALVPPLGGKQNSDIWQKKKSDFVESLGLDPNTKLRASDSPAGLNNLGATCYVNSILQCLYMNEHFRKGLFSVEPHVLNRHPVLNELACLFALLQSSKKASVDSSPFVKTLNLDPNDQQDSDEFLTLFLSLLASCLGSSEISKAKTIVQDLFRGSVSHVKR